MMYATILWSVAGATALVLAMIHSIVGLMDPRARANLAFGLVGFSVVGIAWVELQMMSAATAQAWAGWVRWFQLPVFCITVGMLVFVRTYLGAGRAWLAWIIVALRSFILLANFELAPNFNFRRVESIVREPFLGEEISVVDSMVTSPMQWIATLASVLAVLFIVDATVSIWRQGGAGARRKVAVGAATALFFGTSVFYTQLVIWGVLQLPMLTTPPFLIMLVAMSFELSRDMLRASRLARELKASEERLELAAQAAGLGLLSWNARSGAIWATERARALFDIRPDERLDAAGLTQRIHPDDLGRVQTAGTRATASEGENEVQFRIRRPDGSIRWLMALGRSDADPSGQLSVVHGVVRDVTSQHEAQQQLDELRGELAHANRVSLLGQLSATLAHELRQPLSAILHNAEAAEVMLRQPAPDLAELRDIAQDVLHDVRRAAQVIDRTRALLKRREVDFQPVVLGSLIQDVMALLEADAITRNISIKAVIEPRLGRVLGDKVHLSQVLINLIVNAMDAVAGLSSERRKIIVRAQRGTDDDIEIAVSDCGTGISDEVLPKLFEPFFTTKANGMGIGLCVTRTIIEAHHGSLTVKNNAQHGATFQFALPALDAEEIRVRQTSGRESMP